MPDTPPGAWQSHRQGAPSTIRCIETPRIRRRSRSTTSVREHPAPSGALRHSPNSSGNVNASSQGAPSTIRCIKTCPYFSNAREPSTRQGAPSTIRCIKTPLRRRVGGHPRARRQGAPSTIRCIKTQRLRFRTSTCGPCQGAPSTIRCIKTDRVQAQVYNGVLPRQGAPSTIRCIKTGR